MAETVAEAKARLEAELASLRVLRQRIYDAKDTGYSQQGRQVTLHTPNHLAAISTREKEIYAELAGLDRRGGIGFGNILTR